MCVHHYVVLSLCRSVSIAANLRRFSVVESPHRLSIAELDILNARRKSISIGGLSRGSVSQGESRGVSRENESRSMSRENESRGSESRRGTSRASVSRGVEFLEEEENESETSQEESVTLSPV